MQVYQANEVAPPSVEEALLSKLFGAPEENAETRRRRDARHAGERAQASEARRLEEQRQRELRESQPTCPICDWPISMKEERKEDRMQLPSGAFVHAKCVESP